ncbi:hypothetical protein [Sphingobium sp.]|uniref:hypothetical protein n=1 Tax=Sphingobium sp. TaxID=1912891 RepID=UPI0025DC076F|nr:hypothetical protein [Sphingobium sp.]
MRFHPAPFLALWMAACGAADPIAFDQLEIRAAGLEIIINEDGTGQFNQSFQNKRGRFKLSHQQFANLVKRMEPFRLSGETMTGSEASDFLEAGNRCDGDYVTDNGGISFHWVGPSVDQFYTVDYGCDREKHASRNKELRAILASLPVPGPDGLP